MSRKVLHGIGYALMVGSLLMLLWTNPPDADLERVRLYAVSPQGDTLEGPDYWGRSPGDGFPPSIVPGSPDSVWFALPCRSVSHDWAFFLFAYDTAGNRSDTSNVVTWREPAR